MSKLGSGEMSDAYQSSFDERFITEFKQRLNAMIVDQEKIETTASQEGLVSVNNQCEPIAIGAQVGEWENSKNTRLGETAGWFSHGHPLFHTKAAALINRGDTTPQSAYSIVPKSP